MSKLGNIQRFNSQDFQNGLNIGFAGTQLSESALRLLSLLNNIVLVVIVTDGLSLEIREKRVKEAFRLLSNPGDQEQDGELANQLRIGAHNWRDAINLANTLADMYNLNHVSDEEKAHAAYFMKFALELSDAVRALQREIEPDHGASLFRIIEKYGGAKIIEGAKTMQAIRQKIGREEGPDEITRLIGEYALEKIPEWGRNWALIGKRHYAELEHLEKPSEVQRKALQRYRDGKIPNRTGDSYWSGKFFTDTVRNAYRAVTGTS